MFKEIPNLGEISGKKYYFNPPSEERKKEIKKEIEEYNSTFREGEKELLREFKPLFEGDLLNLKEFNLLSKGKRFNRPESAQILTNHQRNIEILEQLKSKGGKKTIDEIVHGISSASPDNLILYRKEFIEIINAIDKNYAIDQIIERLEIDQELFYEGQDLMILATDLLSAEEVRDKIDYKLNNLRAKLTSENDEYNENRLRDKIGELKYARSFITPNQDKIAVTNLQNFYGDKIKFENYKINEIMSVKEIELLQSLIGKDEKILEEGCGTGRLLLEMKKAGYDITGFDFTKRHVDLIKEKYPDAKVTEGDWHKTPYEDESFDAVYSLGRNILHDYSIVDQAATFRESARILKPGGKFIFDVPNRERGGYRMLVDEYKKEMEARGIRNFRHGTVYDSPDNENFMTRYTFSHEDIEQLAQLAGFKISKVEKRELETGKGDENLYYVLEKTSN